MGKKFKTISSLQVQLKNDILDSLRNKISEICMRVVKDYLLKNVYHSYIPQGDYSYDRTYELMDSVSVGNFKLGYKYATFEIFMDTSKINPYETSGTDWNQHADVDGDDMSEYIPMWIEEGTEGGLWERKGAHYMQDSFVQLSNELPSMLERALKNEGWDVKVL